MTDFELFVLYKDVLIAAKKAAGTHGCWEHVPERDRMIGDDIEFAFSLQKDGKEIAVMEIRFDKSCYCAKSALECKNSLIKSGVAIFENADVHRALKASDIPFCKIEDLFDPMRMIHCGKDAEVYYAEEREKWN
jgi:hypothetical protein